MEKRTCNIILCCKGQVHNEKDEPLYGEEGIAIYMEDECGCPRVDYKGRLLETILKEALFDFFTNVRNPGFELRQLMYDYYGFKEQPTLSQRIMTYFSLVQVRDDSGYINGFTEEQVNAAEAYLHSLH